MSPKRRASSSRKIPTKAATTRRTPRERIVEQTLVGPLMISTVFLGMDHAAGGRKPRDLFETVVSSDWGSRRRPAEDWTRRYTTWQQAASGHVEVLREVRQALRHDRGLPGARAM
jgi:hypothetical protein